MRRVFYCLLFAARYTRPEAAIACAAIYALTGPRSPALGHSDRPMTRRALLAGPTRPRVRAPARARVYTRRVAVCFNSCRQTLPFFAGKRSLISPEPSWAAGFPQPTYAILI